MCLYGMSALTTDLSVTLIPTPGGPELTQLPFLAGVRRLILSTVFDHSEGRVVTGSPHSIKEMYRKNTVVCKQTNQLQPPGRMCKLIGFTLMYTHMFTSRFTKKSSCYILHLMSFKDFCG